MLDAATTVTSATASALALPEILSSIVASAADIQHLSKFRLVSRSFLQACAPFFFIRITDPFFYNGTFSKSYHEIIQGAGHLLRKVSLSSKESFFFDAVASSLQLQALRLTLDSPSPTTPPAYRTFAPLFKEEATVGTRLTRLAISVSGESLSGAGDEWDALCSPRCLLDPESGLKSPLGSILSRLSSLEISSMYRREPIPMQWSNIVDILQHVCPRLTSLRIWQFSLQLRLDASSTTSTLGSSTQDIFPTLTALHLESTLVTIKEFIQLAGLFPNVESIKVRMKKNDYYSSSIDRSVVLPFKSVVFGVITSASLVAVLPMLPRMTHLSVDQYQGEFNIAAVVEAFKGLGGRNQFKGLEFPFQWSKTELKTFIQLDCLRSLESFISWNSAQEFLEAVGAAGSSEGHEGFKLSTPTTTIEPLTDTTAIATTAATPTAPQTATPTQVLPVFLENIKVLSFRVYMGRGARDLTSTHISILNTLLKKMPLLETFTLHRGLLPDLSIFDGLESSHVPRLRRIHFAFAAVSGPLTPEMITTHVIDRLKPSLRILEVSLQGPHAKMLEPWVKTLQQWFKDKDENRSENDLLKTHLTRSMWG
ncbi:hypothetical protein BGW39_007954 [Mortierella sp. 14UC]|nr:hypothetical protein BGW39_007954 [Mortierella sp. 14UC]